jgi:hypothetical protein
MENICQMLKKYNHHIEKATKDDFLILKEKMGDKLNKDDAEIAEKIKKLKGALDAIDNGEEQKDYRHISKYFRLVLQDFEDRQLKTLKIINDVEYEMGQFDYF